MSRSYVCLPDAKDKSDIYDIYCRRRLAMPRLTSRKTYFFKVDNSLRKCP